MLQHSDHRISLTMDILPFLQAKRTECTFVYVKRHTLQRWGQEVISLTKLEQFKTKLLILVLSFKEVAASPPNESTYTRTYNISVIPNAMIQPTVRIGMFVFFHSQVLPRSPSLPSIMLTIIYHYRYYWILQRVSRARHLREEAWGVFEIWYVQQCVQETLQEIFTMHAMQGKPFHLWCEFKHKTMLLIFCNNGLV